MLRFLMDEHTLQNWEKIKALMELNGNTSNTFYKRACQITSGRRDPMERVLGDFNTIEDDDTSKIDGHIKS